MQFDQNPKVLVPQPSGTAHATRIAPFRWAHVDEFRISKDVRRHRLRQIRIEVRHLRKPASKHDNLRIKDVDHVSKSSRQTGRVSGKAGLSRGVPVTS